MPHDFIGLPITGRVFFHHLHLFRRRRLRCNNQLRFSIALKTFQHFYHHYFKKANHGKSRSLAARRSR